MIFMEQGFHIRLKQTHSLATETFESGQAQKRAWPHSARSE